MEDFQKLLNLSYRFLTIRPRSEQEIKKYLLIKIKNLNLQDSQKIIDSVINKLKEQKYLDDKEFIKFWIEQRSKIKPKAFKLIEYELRQKGIKQDLINEVKNDQYFETISDFDKALSLAEKRMERLKSDLPQKQFEKLGRFLASKGFNYNIIKEVIDKLIPKRYNGH
jgi:regulatory protein